MSYDTWKTTNPDDERMGEDRPCKWEKFSGICMVCGAGPNDECEVERERTRVENNQINDALGGFDTYALGYYVSPRG